MNLSQLQPFFTSCQQTFYSGCNWVQSKWSDLSTRVEQLYANAPDVRGHFRDLYASAPDIRGRCRQLYANTPDVRGHFRKHYLEKFYQARHFIWINKGWIVGGAFASYLIWKSIPHIKKYLESLCAEEKREKTSEDKGKEREALKNKQPVEMPIASLSPYHYAKLTIEMPKVKPSPPKLTLTFCIDKSASMIGDRERQVKEGIQGVLDHARNVVESQEGAEVVISAVTFCTSAQIICSPKTINKKTIGQIKTDLNYSSGGGTTILAGLKKATEVLEQAEAEYPGSTHVLIFLSDGEGSCSEIQDIHMRIDAVRARLFAIGIGEEHSKDTLRQIASKEENYIDTTQEGKTIVEAVSGIYKQALATFDNLILSTSQLPAGSWSAGKKKSQAFEGGSYCNIGKLEEKQKERLTTNIQIHPEKLTKPFDLKDLTFTLSFADPRNQEGALQLPWNSNTFINP